MRNLPLIFAVPLFVVPVALWHCSSQQYPADTPQPDAAVASDDDDDGSIGDDTLGDDAGPSIACQIGLSSGTVVDPVSLCFQKAVLEAVRKSGFSMTAGVSTSWDSTTLLPTTDGGAVLHDWRDDAAFGSVITDYLNYASKYGDNQISADLTNVLVALATVLEGELATIPADYDGEPYMHLRNVIAGLNRVNDTTDATALTAIANAYGNGIATTYLQSLGGGDMIVGTCSAPGVCTYETGKAASAALAMLDMAWRTTFTDAGELLDATAPAALTTGATAVLNHLAQHAASPSGMYYRALVTGSTDAGAGDGGASSGDTPVVLDAWPADALLADTQATTMYALLRANALVQAEFALSAASSYPFYTQAEAIYLGMHGTPSLWDTTTGGGGGYFEGYVPSTGALYTNKPSRPNGLVFGALAYKYIEQPPVNPDGGNTVEGVELDVLRTLLTQSEQPNGSLISIVPNQSAYLRAGSATFGLADTYAVDGGVTMTPEPGALNYVAAATNEVLEGLSAQAFGVSDLQ